MKKNKQTDSIIHLLKVAEEIAGDEKELEMQSILNCIIGSAYVGNQSMGLLCNKLAEFNKEVLLPLAYRNSASNN